MKKIFYYIFNHDFFITVGFVKIIPPSRFKCKKYSFPIGFNAIFPNLEIVSKKPYGESCFIIIIFKIKLKFWQSCHKFSKRSKVYQGFLFLTAICESDCTDIIVFTRNFGQ